MRAEGQETLAGVRAQIRKQMEGRGRWNGRGDEVQGSKGEKKGEKQTVGKGYDAGQRRGKEMNGTIET